MFFSTDGEHCTSTVVRKLAEAWMHECSLLTEGLRRELGVCVCVGGASQLGHPSPKGNLNWNPSWSTVSAAYNSCRRCRCYERVLRMPQCAYVDADNTGHCDYISCGGLYRNVLQQVRGCLGCPLKKRGGPEGLPPEEEGKRGGRRGERGASHGRRTIRPTRHRAIASLQ